MSCSPANGVWISSLDGNITFFPFNSGSADIALESFCAILDFPHHFAGKHEVNVFSRV